MVQYSLKRLLLFFPTLFAVTVVIFFLLRIVPGDFAEVLANPDAGTAGAKKGGAAGPGALIRTATAHSPYPPLRPGGCGAFAK